MPLYIGTSGFAYKTWKPAFYPADLPATRFLQYYAERLTALEVNYTFRSLLTASVAARWIAETPATFQFVPKAHMRITHSEKLKDESGFLQAFLDRLEPLRAAQRLGPILFQLPPGFHCDPGRLAAFLLKCPPGYRCAFEFRDPSWFNEEVYAIVRRHGATLCFAESKDLVTPRVYTAPYAYFRMRQPPYEEPQLKELAGVVSEGLKHLQDVYVFFKHEDDPRGVLSARDFLRVLENRAAAPE
jgi:uncharacterized protein YecE (DUF72 family)